MIARLLAKLLARIPVHKLSSRMVYSLLFNVLLFMFMTFLYATGTTIGEFPNAWDYRFMVSVNLAVFVLGIWDAMDRRG
ncbi:hypothetical protein [Paenibacillus sp.]|uniref:hypothetical protein n=1 Tax=Paenibacillus sp. TaxID=58172 RepID=UPI002D2DE2CE|nr:hypothetical protein [Paenibacillus sp.]HZG87327.1 hypothetical protein [Paenibacillus sp.]